MEKNNICFWILFNFLTGISIQNDASFKYTSRNALIAHLLKNSRIITDPSSELQSNGDYKQ